MRRISCSSLCASAGEPSASMTTTESAVTTKAALEMKFWLAGEPSADSPCTNHTLSATRCAAMLPAWASATAGAASRQSQSSRRRVVGCVVMVCGTWVDVAGIRYIRINEY